MRHGIPRQIADQITDERRLNGRTYFLIKELHRKKTHTPHYKAFLPEAGPNGGFRVLHELKLQRQTLQHIDVLKRLAEESNGSFPTILEYCRAGDRVYVITDWVRGHTLKEHLRGARAANNEGAKKITVHEALKLFHWFAGDLCRLHHKRNLVHGDLKPDNLLVRRSPNRLVMIDFGSAWQAGNTAMRHEGDGNVPHYAAPELQHDGVFADFRSDIFAASVILFEMLTLEIPYGKSGGKVPPEDVEATYRPPSDFCRQKEPLTKTAWSQIDHLLATGLQLDPAKRYQSGSDWMKDINAIAADLENDVHPGTRKKAQAGGTLMKPISWLRRRFR